MKRLYLRIGADQLDQAAEHSSIADAKAEFGEVANELRRYGQPIDATLHIAESRDECDEYPDYVLSLGPRGGIRCQRC